MNILEGKTHYEVRLFSNGAAAAAAAAPDSQPACDEELSAA